jgi:hypothetical protein
MLHGFLRRTHLSTPADIAQVTAEQSAEIGADDVDVYLIDHAQEVLVPLPRPGRGALPPLSVAGTIAGRAFGTSTILVATAERADRRRMWIPLLDGTERMGELTLSFREGRTGERLLETCERFAHLVAATVMTKGAYGDDFEFARRQAPMTLAAELVWGLAPPMMFATDDLALAGMLEPAYDNGGDVIDYAINDRTLHLAMFDAMGHGLAAAGAGAFALAAYRHSRRSGHDLTQTHAAMNHAVEEQYPGRRFVTAVVAELDLDSGHLRFFIAGHPPPFIIRDSRHAITPPAVAVPPLGIRLPYRAPVIHEVALEPGDLLVLYSDGLTEARDPDGEPFTPERLTDFVIRQAQAGHPAPEMLRRIRTTILTGGRVELRDDASALLAEWRSGSEAKLLPQTVLR